MALGTAPRRIRAGIWKTRSGQTLTPAQATVWEGYFRAGHTDGRGHFRKTPSVVFKQPPRPPLVGPTTNRVQAKQDTGGVKAPAQGMASVHQGPAHAGWRMTPPTGQTPKERRQAQQYKQVQQARAQAEYNANQALFGGAYGSVLGANKTINPVVGGVLESVGNVAPHLLGALSGGHVSPAGIAADVAFMFPFAKGAKVAKAAIEAGKGVEEGVAAARAGQILPDTSPMAQRAAEAFHASRSGRAAQDVLRSQGFRERVGKQAGAFEEAGGGRAGHYAALGQMKGAYPKIPMHDLLNVNPQELDQLHNEIQDLPHLLPMEKRRLSIALENATKGIRPQENEIKLMHKAFGQQAAAEFANTGKIPINEVISNIANIPRAVMSSFDVSAPFRQGLMAFAMHPTIAARQLPKMFKDLASEAHYQGGLAGIHADPEFENSLKAGVGYTELGPSVARREEQFGSKAAETLTGIGTYVPGMRRGSFSFVRASGRAYTGFLDRVRLELYKHLRQEALAAGHDLGRVRGAGRTTTGQPIASTLDEDIGALVNWATGRGTFKSRKIEAAAPLLNSFLFSPRLFKSRLDAINFLPGGFYHQLDPFARRKAATSLVKLVATGIGVLSLAKYVGGAKIELDPRSSDWGKIRFGNTRYDIWGGYQQTARMIAQEIMQSTKLSTTGEVKHVRHPFDPFLNLIEGKASPPFAGVLDVQRGTMFGHKPVTAWAEAQDKLQPIIIQDIRDAVRSGDWMGVLGTSMLGGLGFGAQTYPPTPTTPTGPHWGGSGGSGGAPHWGG